MTATNQRQKTWVPIEKAAEYMGVSKSSIYKGIASGKTDIPFARIGKKIRFSLEDLNRYLETTGNYAV